MLQFTGAAGRLRRRTRPAYLHHKWKLARLARAGREGAQLAEAIRRTPDRKAPLPPALAEIERIRERLLAGSAPLVDGTLGPAGPLESPVTIADACKASKPAGQALLLYWLARQFKPRTVVELGTNVGISSAYLAAGLKGTGARLVTLDASPYKQRVARAVHEELGIEGVEYSQGLFADTLAPALLELPPVDMAFIDGHHLYEATLGYYETVLAHASPRCVFVFDDIRWSEGMERAWAVLSKDGRFDIVVDLERMGVCIRWERPPRKPFRVAFPLQTWRRRRKRGLDGGAAERR
jgi:predicted O-methyltransferase YrrM